MSSPSRTVLVGNPNFFCSRLLALCHVLSIVLLGGGAISQAAAPPAEIINSDINGDRALPAGFPKPLVPAGNPLTSEKIALGKRLFHDTRLSRSATMSCASCHDPKMYFTDGLARPAGALGELLEFNTPTLLNSAYSASFSWVDKGFSALEEQHVGPLKNEQPVELGLGDLQLNQLSADSQLVRMLGHAFPGATVFTEKRLIEALASYVRTLIRGGSAFDRFVFEDDKDALSEQARAGLALFRSPRLNCVSCHRGFLLSGPTRSARVQFPPSFYQTGVAGSRREFRVPSLRFVKHTAPYMHDGSLPTLEAVIDFYAQAVESEDVSVGPKAAERMVPFKLSIAETHALLAFLESL